MSNYWTKTDLKNATDVTTLKFAKKLDLANSKPNVEKLDFDKLKNFLTNLSNLESKVDKLDVDKLVSVDLSKLCNEIQDDVIKKDVYNTKIKTIEDEIPDITNLATTAAPNAKTNEVQDEITIITNLATTATLTAVENKIPNVSKKTDYNTKINDIKNKITTDYDHDKYIATQEFNKLTSEHVTARLKQANLASKCDIANFVRQTDFDDKLKDITSNKNELNELSKQVKAISAKRLQKIWWINLVFLMEQNLCL